MQAVILAAGEATRMRPLTEHVPKALVHIGEKTIVEHNLEVLPDSVDELIYVVGYLKEQVMSHFGDVYEGRRVRYVVQEHPLGTAHAVSLVQPLITGERFLVMMGDDLYCRQDVAALLSAPESAVLVQKTEHPFSGGTMEFDTKGNLLGINEGEHARGYINAALYVLTTDYFKYEPVAIKGGKEYGLPQTLAKMAHDHPVKVVEARWWQQISTVEDVSRALDILRTRPS